ncbi:hypothetical protein [Arthrobacter sp. OAP107]|jgi:hypothetical protein|uniref:hypothetical protein n=1 Tax=Arthrobacter sp. OAP107 TaxID=3156445 RepID=UPI003392B30A
MFFAANRLGVVSDPDVESSPPPFLAGTPAKADPAFIPPRVTAPPTNPSLNKSRRVAMASSPISVSKMKRAGHVPFMRRA